MKNLIIIIVSTLLSCTTLKENPIGTYKIKNNNGSHHFKKCRQLTLLNNSTYENVTCGEIIYPYYSSWKMVDDTIYFSGSLLGLPVRHSKFLLKKGKLHLINGTKVDDKWIFKKKSKKPRPYKKTV